MIGLKQLLCGTVLIYAAAAGTVHADEAVFQLVRDGQAKTVLILPENPPEPVRKAAAEFTAQVKKSSGASIEPVSKPVEGKNRIQLVCEQRTPDQEDRFSIRFPDERTMLVTGTETSIAFALDYLLENSFKVRRLIMNYGNFRWPDRPKRIDREIEVSCEPVRSAAIPRREVTQTASFNFKRSIYTHASGWKTRASFPGIHDMTKWAFPVSKYAPGNTWPQQILPIINGKRYQMPRVNRKGWGQFKTSWQPCWSNPESVDIAVANIFEQLKIRSRGRKVYSINLDINDNGGCCTCPDCLAVVGRKSNSVGRMNYSNLYWKWVNGIAEKVTKKYPSLYINCLAYREVIDPPDFKLHPNVIPQICRELTATLDPKVKKNIEDLLRRWKEKAAVIFLWDYQYGGGSQYLFPRIYFHRQAELFRMAYRYHARGIFIECRDFIGMEGPKHYLNAKLLWDINTDVDQVLREWCEDAGGKKAAPYLLEYYQFWEKYWERPEIRQTNWFTSAPKTYMQLGEQGTYTYALRKGEMAKLRQLMEKAAAAAETPQQKKRMNILLNEVFAIVEASAKCLFSEYLRPDGTVGSAADAVALLKSVPDAAAALHWLKTRSVLSTRLQGIAEGGLISNFNAVMPYLGNAEVKAEIQKLSADRRLPVALQAQLKIMNGVKFPNLFPSGSFEQNDPVPKGARRHTAHVSDGKYSLRLLNSMFSLTVPGIKPGKTYYIALDVYSGNNSVEGRFNVMLAPRAKLRTLDWKRLTNLKLGKGWQTIAFAYQVPAQRNSADNFLLMVIAKFFESDEPLWVDNIRVYCLDDSDPAETSK